MIILVALAVASLIGVGFSLVMRGKEQALRVAIGFILFSNGVNLAVLSATNLPQKQDLPPLIRAHIPLENYVDPLPQAFVLTAIVISLGAFAFLLAMARRMDVNRERMEEGLKPHPGDQFP